MKGQVSPYAMTDTQETDRSLATLVDEGDSMRLGVHACDGGESDDGIRDEGGGEHVELL